jgi:repressor LexA
MDMQKRPSKKQFELLAYIDGFIRGNGYGPSYREIMRALDYKSVSTVAVHIDGLIAGGHLIKRDRSARSLEVVKTSGNTVEKAEKIEDKPAWFVERLSKTIQNHRNNPSKQGKEDLWTLIESLRILGYMEEYEAQKKVVESLPES